VSARRAQTAPDEQVQVPPDPEIAAQVAALLDEVAQLREEVGQKRRQRDFDVKARAERVNFVPPPGPLSAMSDRKGPAQDGRSGEKHWQREVVEKEMLRRDQRQRREDERQARYQKALEVDRPRRERVQKRIARLEADESVARARVAECADEIRKLRQTI
jgi:hypothetical protein